MEPAEFLLKIFIIATLCFGIIGMVVESASFEGIVSVQEQERLAIDLSQAAPALPCLTEKVNGESRNGLLLESALDNYDEENGCLSLSGTWGVRITDGTKTWTMGDWTPVQPNAEHKKTMPAAIRKADGSVVPAVITVRTVET